MAEKGRREIAEMVSCIKPVEGGTLVGLCNGQRCAGCQESEDYLRALDRFALMLVDLIEGSSNYGLTMGEMQAALVRIEVFMKEILPKLGITAPECLWSVLFASLFSERLELETMRVLVNCLVQKHVLIPVNRRGPNGLVVMYRVCLGAQAKMESRC